MDNTKVQIGDDCLLDLGVNSEWYISTLCYDNESVNVELRRKADRKVILTSQTEPNPYKSFADLLFDKDKQEQFIKKCKAMGINADQHIQHVGSVGNDWENNE